MGRNKKKISIYQKLKGHFLLTRPVQLIWLDIFISLAIYAVIAQHMPNAHYLIFMTCAILADAGASTLNDLGDIKSDSLSTESSRNLRPLPTRTVSKNAARDQGIALLIISLVIALFLDIYVFIFAFLLVILSYQYSMKPLKLDARPIVEQLFWIAFGFLYYFAVAAYLIKYENVSMVNIYNGIYFLITMILFASIAETLAKGLRDLANDRRGGKITTPVYFGPKPTAVASATFSAIGLIFWAYPFFTILDTPLFIKFFILFILILWTVLSIGLCRAIYIKYTKDNARRLHRGYILTFTYVLAITFFVGVT
ncbi:UbiA prenyltransferase family protein [[Eubacterium] cellulosolvens]